jgi:Na+/proline symporter
MNQPKRLVYLLSFFPGLGHFYLGLMNRGLQLMGLFFGLCYLETIGFDNMFIFIPIIVFYAYFDALERYRHWLQYDELKDDNLVETRLFNEKKMFIGWGLIIFGGYFFLNNFVVNFIHHVVPYYFYLPPNLLEKIMISTLFIFVGYQLLCGKKEDNDNSEVENR